MSCDKDVEFWLVVRHYLNVYNITTGSDTSLSSVMSQSDQLLFETIAEISALLTLFLLGRESTP